MKLVPVVIMPDFIIFAEHHEGEVWIHTNVFKWSTSVAKQFKEHLDFVLNTFRKTVYAVNMPLGYNKRRKFMQLMGFEFSHSLTFFGESYDIFKRVYHG